MFTFELQYNLINMKRKYFLEGFLIFISLFISYGNAFSQKCDVLKESLKGTYTGDCKKGKASGQGKAVGTDTYEGEFKSGLPNGEGTYTWKNGNVYKGSFSKGLMDGKGNLTLKRPNATDSIVEGFWKNDVYMGKYEHPYTVFNKSSAIDQADVRYKKDDNNRIIFNVGNTSAGAASFQGSSSAKVDDLIMFSGSIGRTDITSSSPKRIQTTVYDVMFPARMKVVIGGDNFEVEFREPGTYTVDVTVNR